jgi:hypothetical protein
VQGLHVLIEKSPPEERGLMLVISTMTWHAYICVQELGSLIGDVVSSGLVMGGLGVM